MKIGRPATTNAFPQDKRYWGQQGQWGPFSAEASGRPNAAEVLRDGMQQANLDIKEVLDRYNQEMVRLGKHPISLSRMYRMTRAYKQIPEDIIRREVLARVCQVSPLLLGVVPVQELVFTPESTHTVAVPTVLQRVSVDLEQQESLLKCLWQIYYTSAAYIDVQAIQRLETFEQQTQGNAQAKARELLYSHHRLANSVARRDQANFADAVRYADQAITVAERMQDEELLSGGWYARGYAHLLWGESWKVGETGLLVPNAGKIKQAITDFDHALSHHPRPQLAGNILMLQSRAYTSLKEQDPFAVSKARTNMERAAKLIGKDPISDLHLRILLDGDPNGFNEGMYRLLSAVILNGLGRGEDALDELDALALLDRKKGIARTQTGKNAWSSIIRASASLKRADYFSAAQEAIHALLLCQDIDSVGNILLIRDLYARLVTVGYRSDLVEELGQELARYSQAKHVARKATR